MRAVACWSSNRLIHVNASLVTPFTYLFCDVDRVWCCATFLPDASEVTARFMHTYLLSIHFCFYVVFVAFFPHGKKESICELQSNKHQFSL